MVTSLCIVSYSDYNFSWFKGAEEQKCMCGAAKCRGFIRKKNAAPGTKFDLGKSDGKGKASQSSKGTKHLKVDEKTVHRKLDRKSPKGHLRKSSTEAQSKSAKVSTSRSSGKPEMVRLNVKRVVDGRITKISPKKGPAKGVKHIRALVTSIVSNRPQGTRIRKLKNDESRNTVVSKVRDSKTRKQSSISTSTTVKRPVSEKIGLTKHDGVSGGRVYDTVGPRYNRRPIQSQIKVLMPRTLARH
jgi:hypothetical protein